jgi:hypothetical protein
METLLEIPCTTTIPRSTALAGLAIVGWVTWIVRDIRRTAGALDAQE